MPPAATTAGKPALAKFQALTNVSVPQRTEQGVLTGQNDLAVPGDIVELTEREAANLMDCSPRSGRRTPAVRPFKDRSNDLPRIHPRQLSGLIRQPAVPPPGTDGPRPDPEGSSQVRIVEAGPVPPEFTEPQPGSETGGPLITGALDLPPRRMAT
jgi:hypothetical protein